MAETVSDFLLKRLIDWGVKRVYGYPGDGINGILGAFGRIGDKLKFVQVRHEEMAAFMACGHAKFTGEVGVCLATSGPGAIHLLNGLYDAKMDHRPVVAIVGQAATTAIGSQYQQEVDLKSLFKDVASDYVVEVESPAAIRHAIDRAFRIAKADRTVTCVIIPKDLQEEKAVERPPHLHDTAHSGVGWAMPKVVPMEKDLKHAADVLNAGKKVAMLVGAGAFGCQDEICEVADLLGAGVAKALLGITTLDDRIPYVTGSIGLLGTKPSWVLMSECDTLLMVGSGFPYSEFLPKEGQARGVQIDLDAKMLSIRYPMEVNLCGDAKTTLEALAPLLKRKTDRSWQEKIVAEKKDWEKVIDAQAQITADPLNPQRVFRELSPRLPDNCVVTADSGSSCNWLARDLVFRRGMMASVSGNLATMGCGVPYAIAAKFAWPERHVIACVGDGAMQMNGLAELITISKYWKEWKTPGLCVLVLNNRDLNQVTWEQRAMAGDPKLEATQNLPDFPYARYADSIGLIGIKIDEPEQVAQAWERALSADRPVVLEAYVDGNVPTLPPHITLKEAKMFASSVLHGDKETGGMIKETVKEAFERIRPHKK
jgi:pyruvate dehydrogenase (quinone)